MGNQQKKTYEFLDFRLDAAHLLLYQNAREIALAPKVIETLLALVEHQGKILSKDELMKIVWADSIVEEGNLFQNLYLLRKILGENEDDKPIIETLRRRGYRFNATVKSAVDSFTNQSQFEAETFAPLKSTQNGSVADNNNSGKVLSAKWEKSIDAFTAQNNKSQTASIAVLPFVNMSADAENEYFCDGLAEEFLNALAKINGLRVAARTSSFSFKNKDINISEIGRVLDVGTVLEGSVRKAGKKVRITVQLINTANGYHLWSERYDREIKDIFELQDEITLAVVTALKVKLLKKKKSAVLKHYTDNTKAYEFYLKGKYFFNQHTSTGWRKGIEYFEQAILIESNYAPAYAGIALSLSHLWFFGFLLPEETVQKWRTAASRALEIDADLPEAHYTQASLHFFYEWNWAAAEREYRRAIELNQNNAEAHWRLGLLLVSRERFDEAVAAAERAIELDPLSLVTNLYVGLTFWFAQRINQAFAQVDKMLELEPRFHGAYWLTGTIQKSLGSFDEAVAAYQKALSLGGNQTVLSILGNTYALAGKRAEALATLDQLFAIKEQQFVAAYNIARVYGGLSETDVAFEWLEKAFRERNGELVFLNLLTKLPAGVMFGKEFLEDQRLKNLLRQMQTD